ncbi:hypothetical protein [Seongchinamella unica]|uniref:hypothetical protein n=1 Tax=Seongchinamella unica TaxID=2547392 RepID=UPI0014053EBF|nr:hypothetical protein [Seongchinamella unica]
MNETPLGSETVERQPDESLVMRVDVTVKIYKNRTTMVAIHARAMRPTALDAGTAT